MTDPYSRPATPWDLYNKNLGRVAEVVSKERMEICKTCPNYVALTHQCTKCGCFMNLKTQLPNAVCPIGKWDQVKVGYTE
jgi:hypothetical protein